MDTLNIYREFEVAESIDDLWNRFCLTLYEYKVTSVFYAIGHTTRGAREDGLFESTWFKSNHPEEYQQYFDSKFLAEDDHTVMHCLTSTSPYIWHDPIKFEEQTETQKKFVRKAREFNMGVGVTLPIRFNHFGIGGFGLCMGGLNEDEFDIIWNTHKNTLRAICHAFDEILRTNFMLEIYPLTQPEIDALSGLVEGKNIQTIANDLGKSPSTLEKQIRSARTKLGAKNDKQASVKAVILGIISS